MFKSFALGLVLIGTCDEPPKRLLRYLPSLRQLEAMRLERLQYLRDEIAFAEEQAEWFEMVARRKGVSPKDARSYRKTAEESWEFARTLRGFERELLERLYPQSGRYIAPPPREVTRSLTPPPREKKPVEPKIDLRPARPKAEYADQQEQLRQIVLHCVRIELELLERMPPRLDPYAEALEKLGYGDGGQRYVRRMQEWRRQIEDHRRQERELLEMQPGGYTAPPPREKK